MSPERLGDILKHALADMEPGVAPAPGSPRAMMLAFFREDAPLVSPKEQPSQPDPAYTLQEEPF